MLVPKFNAVKVESVPLNSDEFRQPRRAATTQHYDGKEQAAHVLVSFLERALARRGGEPGVVVAHRTRQTESG